LKEEFKNIIKVACLYMTSVIGAGFASGREIVQFFTIYYEGGFYGIVLAGFLFASVGMFVLDEVYIGRIKNYDEFLFPILGWRVGRLFEIAATLFMLSVFYIMAAGSTRILMDAAGLPFGCAVLITVLIYLIILSGGIRSILFLSSVTAPLLLAGMLLTGLFIIMFKDITVINIFSELYDTTHNWVFSSLLYVGYNSLISVAVMCSLLPYLKTRRTGITGGIIGGAMLCMAALVLNYAVYLFYNESVTKEIPLIFITQKYNKTLAAVYSVVLWFSMLVSAATSGYAFIDRFCIRLGINRSLAVTVVCALLVPLSSTGFSKLIASIYPVFGYIGLFMVVVILIRGTRSLLAELSGRKL